MHTLAKTLFLAERGWYLGRTEATMLVPPQSPSNLPTTTIDCTSTFRCVVGAYSATAKPRQRCAHPRALSEGGWRFWR
jgi:hypothetical protein